MTYRSVLVLVLVVLANAACSDKIDDGDMVQRLMTQSGLTWDQANCVEAKASDLPSTQLLGEEPMDEQEAENYQAILHACAEEDSGASPEAGRG